MGWGFEITDEDVRAVLAERFGSSCSLAEAVKILEGLDAAEIERAALRADDLESQTAAAYDEIERQLKAKGFGAERPPS